MRFKLASAIEDTVQLYHFRGGYAGVVRIDPATINVAFVIDRASLRDRISFPALRRQYLEQNPRLRDLLRAGEPCGKLRSIWPVYFAPRRRHGDGFALVGDAAQVTEPLTGEGIYFALKSGQLAARSIAEAWRHAPSSGVDLTHYQDASNREFSQARALQLGLRLLMRRAGFVRRRRAFARLEKGSFAGPAPSGVWSRYAKAPPSENYLGNKTAGMKPANSGPAAVASEQASGDT